MGFLKGKSSLIIFKRYSHLKYKYENRQFWCKGYYIDTAGKNAKKIAEYIQNQLKENQVEDQMTMKKYIETCLWVASNSFFADDRPYQRLEAWLVT